MSGRLIWLSLMVFSLISPPCAGQAADVVSRPNVKVGDSWTYRGTNIPDTGRHEYETKVSFADDKVILLVSTRKSDGKEFDSTWTADWNAMSSYTGRTYRPSMGAFRFPMSVGDRHTATSELFFPRTPTANFAVTYRSMVSRWEDVTVPAGNFKALRIDVEGEFRPFDGSKPRRPQITYWYVPAVKRWVRLLTMAPEGVVLEEVLLEYKLQQ